VLAALLWVLCPVLLDFAVLRAREEVEGAHQREREQQHGADDGRGGAGVLHCGRRSGGRALAPLRHHPRLLAGHDGLGVDLAGLRGVARGWVCHVCVCECGCVKGWVWTEEWETEQSDSGQSKAAAAERSRQGVCHVVTLSVGLSIGCLCPPHLQLAIELGRLAVDLGVALLGEHAPLRRGLALLLLLLQGGDGEDTRRGAKKREAEEQDTWRG